MLLQHPRLNQLSNLSNAMCDVSFLRSDWRCRRYLIVLSNVTLRYLGLEQRCRVSFPWLTFSSSFPSMFLRWKTADTVFAALSFNFQLLTCGCRVFVSTSSTAFQYPSPCTIARSSVYAYFSGDVGWQVKDVDAEEKEC